MRFTSFRYTPFFLPQSYDTVTKYIKAVKIEIFFVLIIGKVYFEAGSYDIRGGGIAHLLRTGEVQLYIHFLLVHSVKRTSLL